MARVDRIRGDSCQKNESGLTRTSSGLPAQQRGVRTQGQRAIPDRDGAAGQQSGWNENEIARRAAALAFYTFLGLSPPLIIMMSIPRPERVERREGLGVTALVGGAEVADGSERPLASLPLILGIARRARRVIRTDLLWAFVYNAVAIPLATTGRLSPMAAAAAMALSSPAVVANSARLRVDRPYPRRSRTASRSVSRAPGEPEAAK